MENLCDVNSLCRTCLTESQDMKTIFDVIISEEHNVRIVDFIRRLTSLKIARCNDLPSNICTNCIEQLCRAYTFSEMCIESNSKLKSNKQLVQKNLPVLYTPDNKENCSALTPNEELSTASLVQDNSPLINETSCDLDANLQSPSQNTTPSDCLAKTDSYGEIIIIKHYSDNHESSKYSDDEAPGTLDSKTDTVAVAYSAKEDTGECLEEGMGCLEETIERTERNEDTLEDAPEYVKQLDLYGRQYTDDGVSSAKRCRRIRNYRCEVCSQIFITKSKLKKHEQVHDPSRPYKCGDCYKTFSKSIQLQFHSRSHVKGEDKQFVCKICGQRFTYSYLLKRHAYKHEEKKPFPCSKCDRGCVTAESLRRHMRVHDENYVKKTHVCDVCSKEFPYPSFLAEHMKNHTGEKPFLCSICGKGFRQSGTLEYHMRSHTGMRPYACDICDSSFTSPGILRSHMRRHTDERPYICDICGMAFRQSTDMKTHRRLHTGDKPVLCTICGKRMSSTGQLTVHIRSHTGEKPFACGTCPKAFATRTMLVKHERIHSGEKPYVCNICGKSFNQSSTLKTHSNMHKVRKEDETEAVKHEEQILSDELKTIVVHTTSSMV